MSTTHPVIDARGMECPEPFEVVSREAMLLAPGESFILRIGIRPQPLLDFLERRNFRYEIETMETGELLILITAQHDSIQQREALVEPPSSCRSTGRANP